ncbi:hypothetical protein Vafri_14030 [Volvox africanus]|uniref:Uncharacterized protein n=1 Tax=Volvox africanus TaxID=51714 RepID=A0A8J4BI17_9CHLO|nr:hypothetical protein Vafri_14030 [Volvox africanus]
MLSMFPSPHGTKSSPVEVYINCPLVPAGGCPDSLLEIDMVSAAAMQPSIGIVDIAAGFGPARPGDVATTRVRRTLTSIGSNNPVVGRRAWAFWKVCHGGITVPWMVFMAG